MSTVISCVHGQMGNTNYYQATMKASELVKVVRPAKELDEWSNMSIEDRLQREPDIKRIEEQIAPYIAKSQDRFFGAVIVLVYKGKIVFESINKYVDTEAPEAYKSAADSIGIMTIKGGTYIMLDGQHRLLALEKIIKNDIVGDCREEVPNDDICVIFIEHESNEKTRRIFNKVNRYAKPTSRGDNIITSEDDRSAIIARKLLSDGAPLGIQVEDTKGNKDVIVEWKNNTIAARSIKLTTISVVYETVKLILSSEKIPLDQNSRPSEEEIQQYYELVEKFWSSVLDGLQAYQDAIANCSEIPTMRKDEEPYSLLFKSTAQIALFKGLIAATRKEGLNLEEAVRRANQIDWSISSTIWKNVLVTPSGTITRAQKAQNLGGRLIAYLIAADKMTPEEIDVIQREYNSAQGIDVNSPDIELIPLPKPVVELVLETVEASA
ncbi:DGQHR domain-containing protein [Rivularia sp. PCC 7116]|uniref:DNA sulfur modification protein DndB n=1 Tax=Rivularia sp. PCC 7116 TaxID=373994 RepID=UPI00029EFDB1|nr:DNA sulfur modification protein DndB [Rivularia sp. PCC 7116]AFY55648.1 DGQHR domain-containing protein [Rivularia sp. PCC 7116]